AVGRIECQLLDVTERRRLEERRRAKERTEDVAALAAATAHEILNPLTAGVGRLQLLERRPMTPEQRKQVTPALEAASRIRDVIHQMLTVVRVQYQEPCGLLAPMLDMRGSASGNGLSA